MTVHINYEFHAHAFSCKKMLIYRYHGNVYTTKYDGLYIPISVNFPAALAYAMHSAWFSIHFAFPSMSVSCFSIRPNSAMWVTHPWLTCGLPVQVTGGLVEALHHLQWVSLRRNLYARFICV